MSHLKLFFIYPLLISSIFISCENDETCNDPVQPTVNIGFYTYQEGTEIDQSFDGFTAQGIDADTLFLYDQENDIHEISLPLSPLADASAFILTFTLPDTNYVQNSIPVIDSIILEPEPDTLWVDSVFIDTIPYTYELSDTITFYYERELVMLSKECGFTYFFDIHDIEMTFHVIKSYAILEPEIVITDEESVKFYF